MKYTKGGKKIEAQDIFGYVSGNAKFRLNHTKLILNTIRQFAPISRVELVLKTDLSKPTVTRVTEELLEQGLIIEKGAAESAVGRKAVYLELNPNSIYCIGLNLTHNNLYGSLIDITMNICYSSSAPVRNIKTEEDFNRLIFSAIELMITESGISKEKIIGIGLGVPGLANPDTGVIKRLDIRNKIYNLEIKKAVEERFSLGLIVDNNANTRALGEYWFGFGADIKTQNLIYVIASEGVGAGVISGGRILRGKNNTAAELGEMIVAMSDECTGGRIEDYCSTEALEAKMKMDFSNICKEAINTDGSCRRMLQKGAKTLGVGVANMIALFDPEIIVMSGRMFDEYPDFFQDVVQMTEFISQAYVVNGKIPFYIRRSKEALYEIGASALIYKAYLND